VLPSYLLGSNLWILNFIYKCITEGFKCDRCNSNNGCPATCSGQACDIYICITGGWLRLQLRWVELEYYDVPRHSTTSCVLTPIPLHQQDHTTRSTPEVQKSTYLQSELQFFRFRAHNQPKVIATKLFEQYQTRCTISQFYPPIVRYSSRIRNMASPWSIYAWHARIPSYYSLFFLLYWL
jgi:hypothetical protein